MAGGWSGYSERGQGSAERGPGTFAFAPPGTPQAQATQQRDLQLRNQRGRDNTSININQRAPDPTLGLLFKFADAATKPALEAARGKAFLEGVNRAAAGEALTEIINDQPWYGKIFGESASVEGARAYTIQSQVDKWAASFDENIGEYRKIGTDQLTNVMMEGAKALRTGDASTDAMIGMSVVKQLPGLVKRHTREHYKYNQEEMAKAQFSSWQASAASLQIARTAEPGMYSEQDISARTDSLYAQLAPPPGQDPESYEKGLRYFLTSTAEQGQFHVLGELERAGVIDALKPDDQLAVKRSIGVYKKQHAAAAANDYIDTIIETRYSASQAQISGADVKARYDGINADYAARTGNTEPVMSKSETVSTSLTALQALATFDKAQAKAIAKLAAGQGQIAEVDKALNTMTTKDLKDTGQVKAQIIDDAFKRKFDAAESPAAQALLLARDASTGGKVDYIQSDIRRLLNNNGDTADNDFLKAYGWYKELMKLQGPGRSAVNAYFGDKDASRMAAFHEALGGRDVAEFGEYAYARTLQVRVDPGYRFNKDEAKEVTRFIDDQIASSKWYATGTYDLTGSAKLAVSNVMAATYGTLKASTDPKLALQDSFERAGQKGLEVFGSHAWVTDPFRPRLETLIGPKGDGDGLVVTKKEISDGLNALVNARVKAVTDKSPDDVMVIRLPEEAGVAQFMAYINVGGQVMPPTIFNGDDLYAQIKDTMTKPAREAAKKLERKQQGTIDSTTGFGPQITFRPKPGARSPYVN